MNIVSLPINAQIRISTKKASYEGLLLPKEGDEIVLKLKSGYNIGLLPKHITNAKVLEKPKKKEPAEKHAVHQNESLPKVMILHTGGTIASKVDYETGGVVAQFSPDELIGLFPELQELAFIESELVGNMQSDDFRFAHFNIVAKKIFAQAKKGANKFIVTSGTDFLHYLATALSFILSDVPVGVLVVGAQRSSDRGSSDAGMNLACATQFLATQDFRGVGVCMHASIEDDACVILPGVNVRKMHSSRRDAFKPINKGPLAKVSYSGKQVTLLEDLAQANDNALPRSLSLLDEQLRIGMVWAKPQMFPEEFGCYDEFDGLVLVMSGLGHFPITAFDDHCKLHGVIHERIRHLAVKMPVVAAVQTIYGRVDMDVYSPGRALQEAGVIGNGSVMSPETAYIKLAWLLSNHEQDVKKSFLQDFVGEMNSDESNLYW
ncbi:Glu-tRNA(Gln) amidotransferase subunit GatD [Candidatus Woesearchaeota archaeon]|nr:Glu-tRNA(Gln) amidotransferase subunit GatD [Candidatus Woesearchaeota archaeon]